MFFGHCLLLAGGDEGFEALKCLESLGVKADLCAEAEWVDSRQEQLSALGWSGAIIGPDSIYQVTHVYDLFLSSGFQRILPEAWLVRASAPKLNLHASILPRYRGRHGGIWAMIRDEKFTGVSLHHMVAAADAGPIVRQSVFPLAYWSTLSDIQASLKFAQATVLRDLFTGDIDLDSREIGVLPDQLWPTRKPNESIIDWSQSPRELFCFARALSRPGVFAFGNLRSQRIEFEAVIPTPFSHEANPGTIVDHRKNQSILVTAKDNALVEAKVVRSRDDVGKLVGFSFDNAAQIGDESGIECIS